MEKKIQRLRSELLPLYEADKRRLLAFQQEYRYMKRRLEREKVLEALDLHNCRVQLETDLERMGNQIVELTERKAQYDSLFM